MILVFRFDKYLLQKITKLLFSFEPVQLLLVLLKFRIRKKKIRNYSRIPNYSEVAIPK